MKKDDSSLEEGFFDEYLSSLLDGSNKQAEIMIGYEDVRRFVNEERNAQFIGQEITWKKKK